jgi:hypothetical protein
MRAEMGMLILSRFPVMKSRNLSSIYCSKAIRYTTIQSALATYHKDALVSLLFLKKIQSIEFWERQQDSGTLVQRWNVSASKTPIPGSKAERLKIESREQPLDVSRVNLSRQPTIREWIVFSSTLPEHHIRNSSALETNRKHKVEARCGIAAQISPKPIVKRGRLFMDVPTSQYLGLPVTISAVSPPVNTAALAYANQKFKDLVVQSDRKILPATGQDGADWNQWMFESQIAPLYAFFLEVLSHIPECDVYNYWPERPIQSKPDGDISYLVSRAFWDQVLDSKSLLFPVKTCDTKDSGAVNETIDYAAPHQARFNLLDNTLVNQLLPKLDLEEWKVVNLKGAAHLGFRSLYESNSCRENLNVISPEFVSGILKSGENAAILHETWKTEHRFSMSFMNSLLKFMTGAGLSTLDGCRILPLATNTLGCLGLGGSRASDFLIPPNESTLRKEILSLFPGVSVHPELTKDVLDTLIPAKPEGAPILNISRFSIEHLPRLISMLKDIDLVQKYNFAVAVWGWYNKLQDAESLNAMEILKTLPVIAATKANDESTYEFLTLEDYNSGVLPAVIKSLFDGKGLLLSWELDALNKMLQSFTGLLLISPNTFPAKSANDQRLVNPGGLHRFLNCIKTLAEKKGCNIESFVRDTFSANPEMLKVREPIPPEIKQCPFT